MVKPTILVLDDESTICLTLSYFLGKAGYEVSTCAAAEEALELVRKGAFFLVLADLVLSDKGTFEGLDVLRTIRRERPETLVMVMTAYGSPELRQRVLAEGACHYWDKPLPMERLLEEIRGLEILGEPGHGRA